jgi:two-component system, OmpR family, phosphate regulon sensor histidine kinase PhoR
MKAQLTRPVFDRDEYYESSSRSIRWICLVLVLISFPFTAANGMAVLTLISLTALYNALRYIPRLLDTAFFGSRINSLAVDHVFVLTLVLLSGGLASPYYTFFLLLMLSVIASYGISGFAFALSGQVVVTLVLLSVSLSPLPAEPEFQFIIKLVSLIIFALVAEQSVRSQSEEYLLTSRFTHRVENERQRLLALINSLSNAVLAINDEGKVYLYNAAALELLNTNEDITGASIDKLLPLHNDHGDRVHMLHLITDQDRTTNRQDLSYTATDGSKIVLDLTISPVRVLGFGHQGWGGYMAVFRDITKEKSLDDQRDEFISVTSHELRTPLAIAEANLSTALLPGYAKIDTKAKELLGQAHENVVFLSQLIEDLTTLAKAERKELTLKTEPLVVRDFATALVRDYRSQAEAKHLKLELTAPEDLGTIITSEHELREILQNFLTNAIKYTSKGTVTVSVARQPDRVLFAVRDSGIGISASDKHKIFAKFYRSEDYRTRQTGGTGLGLYITHKLAEKMGAKITFSSRLNHGSTFNLLVPLAPPAKPQDES